MIFTSVKWADAEAAPGVYSFAAQDFVQRAVCSRGLKLILLLDASALPAWLLAQHPGAAAVDALGERRGGMSFLHQSARALFYRWADASLARVAEVGGACVHSLSIAFDNEHERKSMLESDAFQDYAPPAEVGPGAADWAAKRGLLELRGGRGLRRRLL